MMVLFVVNNIGISTGKVFHFYPFTNLEELEGVV